MDIVELTITNTVSDIRNNKIYNDIIKNCCISKVPDTDTNIFGENPDYDKIKKLLSDYLDATNKIEDLFYIYINPEHNIPSLEFNEFNVITPIKVLFNYVIDNNLDNSSSFIKYYINEINKKFNVNIDNIPEVYFEFTRYEHFETLKGIHELDAYAHGIILNKKGNDVSNKILSYIDNSVNSNVEYKHNPLKDKLLELLLKSSDKDIISIIEEFSKLYPDYNAGEILDVLKEGM